MSSISRKWKKLLIVLFFTGTCTFTYAVFKLNSFSSHVMRKYTSADDRDSGGSGHAGGTIRKASDNRPTYCDPENRLVKTVNCEAIFNMNETELVHALNVMKDMKPTPEDEILRQFSDCDSFKKKHNYILDISPEEHKFPLAYSILFYKDFVQVEKLLRAIYRPHNWYCLHIDAKAPFQLHYAVIQLVTCFDNVFIASKLEEVVYSSFSRLQADINCMMDLISRNGSWKYFINLPSQVYPLKTNAELVEILKVYNGANDIEGITGKRMLPERYQYRHAIYFSRKDETSYIKRTNKRKTPPPHKITIVKGSAYGVFSKSFVQYILFDKRARDLLQWMQDISSPDEYYWATLNHLQINKHLNTPGGYKGDPNTKPWLATYAGWREKGDPCFGRWVRNICVFGIGDILYLTEKKHLFANKFYVNQQPLALDCMEEWLLKKACKPLDLDLSYYKGLPFIKT
ncbi:N-acetyllactosaminide beta-1,6-N-acetylglucosaminyl-transferase-like [Octopus sinensis]|uniref:N-acetyllactosaminide beta-1,6-N-acetylglucosaminyl-transferase-like n=1 Tax=Octopus sinensis TaxID=2607531 RepID=A0A6P7T7V5_9MOLL|nr:N-acetyllactosaminide beta-1,6-N-acetylglucosaminyl-transferase-like [Octopus sinensis]